MTRTEAEEILNSRKQPKQILTVEFARRLNPVCGGLPDSTTFNDLYMAAHTRPDVRAGEVWYDLVSGLERPQKTSLTRALIGPSTRQGENGPLTLRELRGIRINELEGWKVRQVTAAFLVETFRQDAD